MTTSEILLTKRHTGTQYNIFGIIHGQCAHKSKPDGERESEIEIERERVWTRAREKERECERERKRKGKRREGGRAEGRKAKKKRDEWLIIHHFSFLMKMHPAAFRLGPCITVYMNMCVKCIYVCECVQMNDWTEYNSKRGTALNLGLNLFVCWFSNSFTLLWINVMPLFGSLRFVFYFYFLFFIITLAVVVAIALFDSLPPLKLMLFGWCTLYYCCVPRTTDNLFAKWRTVNVFDVMGAYA